MEIEGFESSITVSQSVSQSGSQTSLSGPALDVEWIMLADFWKEAFVSVKFSLSKYRNVIIPTRRSTKPSNSYNIFLSFHRQDLKNLTERTEGFKGN